MIAELERRTAQSGVAEKASRAGAGLTGVPMDQLVKDQLVATEKYSPYSLLCGRTMGGIRAPARRLRLTQEEVRRLSSLNDPIDLDEVKRIYLSMSRLLSVHVESSQLLFRQRRDFFQVPHAVKTPFVIGIAGSVAVGKSTTARLLKELLQRWPSSPKVDLVTTDGFLLPNEVLRRQNLMERKGFPGQLRRRRASALPVGHQVRTGRCAGACLFAPHL